MRFCGNGSTGVKKLRSDVGLRNHGCDGVGRRGLSEGGERWRRGVREKWRLERGQ